MTLIRIPLTIILLLVIALLLAPLLQNPMTKPLPVYQVPPKAAIISEGGSFDPKDLCRQYNAAFRAAGVPELCTEVELAYARSQISTVHFKNGDDIIAQLDIGVERSEAYKRYGLPPGKDAWQTALRVYKPYTGNGFGEAIVRNYDKVLRSVGAKSGDIQILIAGPDKKIMSEQYADAWETFIARLCVEYNATPINTGLLPGKVGCWRFLP